MALKRRIARRRLLGLLLLAVPALVLGSTPVMAHAILVESTPAANADIAGPEIAFSFRYNSRIDKARSRLTLTLPDQTQSVLAIVEDGPEDVLTTKATLPPGSYSIRWQVLAIDGHITRGDVPFQVTAAPPQ